MNKKMLFSTLGAMLLLSQVKAQPMAAAVGPDLAVPTTFPMPASNTGVAVVELGSGAGLTQITAVVADDNVPTSAYQIHWFDASGFLHDTELGEGSDPDVTFMGGNADRCFVAYTNSKIPPNQIWIDDYQLFASGGVDYVLQNSWNVDAGHYPNIDHSNATGAVSYQKANNLVFAAAFTAAGPGPGVFAGFGYHPDIVVLENFNEGVLTFIRNGNLHVQLFDYAALAAGSYVVLASNVFPSGNSPYDYPRVAAARNCLSPDLYTVVAERTTASGSDIEAFTFNSGSLVTSTIVNNGLQNCTNTRPVVTYNCDRISIAFSSDYTSCSFSVIPVNATRTDVLLRNYTSNLTLISPTYHEVNTLQGAFAQGNASLNSLYSPSVTSGTAYEVTTYTKNDRWYWKSRNYGSQYRLAAPGEEAGPESKDLRVSLVQNPVSSTVLLRAEDFAGVNFRMMNHLGQQIELSGKLTCGAQQVAIDVQDLPAGMYFIQCEKEGRDQLIKLIHN